MKQITKALFIAPFAFLAAIPAYAGYGPHRMENRLERQQERIDAGMDSGALTHKEARLLKREQKQIRKFVRKIRKDGEVTKKERRKLLNRLDHASQRIRELKHNDIYRLAKAERCFDSGGDWRNGRHHRWSYELNAWPRYSYR